MKTIKLDIMKCNFILMIMFFTASVLFSQTENKILYVSSQTSSGLLQVFVMNGDGSNKQQVTNIPTNCLNPKWSPDMKQIVFNSESGGVYWIREVEFGKMNFPIYISKGTNPSFVNNGTQIIFNSEVDDVLSILLVDTSNIDDPVILSHGNYSNQQVITEDGTKLLYSGFYDGGKCVLLADLDDTTDNYLKKININEDAALEPDIFNNGEEIVYACFNNQLRGTIYIKKGDIETPLTKGIYSANRPKFSPKGNKIAFVAINGMDADLYIMNLDGSDKVELPIKGGNVGTFEWIDDEKILYDAETNNTAYSIGIINIKTNDCKMLATGGFNLHPDIP